MNLNPGLIFPIVIALSGATVASARADNLADTMSKVKVQTVIPLKVRAFPLQDVRLLDGPFKHAEDMDAAYLLSLDVDRLLYNFRINAGLPSTAVPLGGWEEPKCELRGHFVRPCRSYCPQIESPTRHK